MSKAKDRYLKTISSYATKLDDIEMLHKINVAKSDKEKNVAYHPVCSTNYFGKSKNFECKAKETVWSAKHSITQVARDRLYSYVTEEIVVNKQILSLTHLKHCFIEFLEELYIAAGLPNDYSFTIINNICNSIQEKFKKKIKAVLLDKKTYFMSPQIDINKINDEEIREIIFEQDAKEFAMKFRANILKIKSKPLPEYLDGAALEKGECETPRWLQSFWTTVLNGIIKKILIVCTDWLQIFPKMLSTTLPEVALNRASTFY